MVVILGIQNLLYGSWTAGDVETVRTDIDN